MSTIPDTKAQNTYEEDLMLKENTITEPHNKMYNKKVIVWMRKKCDNMERLAHESRVVQGNSDSMR